MAKHFKNVNTLKNITNNSLHIRVSNIHVLCINLIALASFYVVVKSFITQYHKKLFQEIKYRIYIQCIQIHKMCGDMFQGLRN